MELQLMYKDNEYYIHLLIAQYVSRKRKQNDFIYSLLVYVVALDLPPFDAIIVTEGSRTKNSRRRDRATRWGAERTNSGRAAGTSDF